jgi:hypothetical protein
MLGTRTVTHTARVLRWNDVMMQRRSRQRSDIAYH